MNIFELLSFDFVEFVTSPAGILIVVGILLLIVGIIMFLKDGKSAPVQDVTAVAETTPEVKKEETPAPVEPTENKEVVVEPVVEEKPVEAAPIVVETEGDGVKEVAVEPLTEKIDFSAPAETPAVEPVAPAVENLVSPVEPVKTESIEAPAVEAAPAVETLEEPTPAIYGGASPEVSTEVFEEKPREIYGGANPLENTAPIPAIPAKEEAPAAPTVTPVVEPVQPEAPEEKKEDLEKLEF